MKIALRIATALLAVAALSAQDPVVVVGAGRLFDAKSGTMLTNQFVLIRGDRIADVGANVAVPGGARVIDLGGATVRPGMIDAHVHVALNVPNESLEHHTFVMIQSAQRDLDAGFTTIVDMDSRGGFGTAIAQLRGPSSRVQVHPATGRQPRVPDEQGIYSRQDVACAAV